MTTGETPQASAAIVEGQDDLFADDAVLARALLDGFARDGWTIDVASRPYGGGFAQGWEKTVVVSNSKTEYRPAYSISSTIDGLSVLAGNRPGFGRVHPVTAKVLELSGVKHDGAYW